MSTPTIWPSPIICKHPNRYTECPDCGSRLSGGEMINWPSQDGELRAEIDRLRAEMKLAKHRHLEQATQWTAELDRLQAENARLQAVIESELDHSKVMFTTGEKRLRNAIHAILAKTAKEGE